MGEHEMVRHVFSNFRHVAEVLLHCPVVITVLTAIIGSFKVVVAGGAITIPISFPAMGDHFLHPLLFSLVSAIEAVYIVLSNKIDALSYMFPLAIQYVCQIEREEGLVSAHDEEIGVAL